MKKCMETPLIHSAGCFAFLKELCYMEYMSINQAFDRPQAVGISLYLGCFQIIHFGEYL